MERFCFFCVSTQLDKGTANESQVTPVCLLAPFTLSLRVLPSQIDLSQNRDKGGSFCLFSVFFLILEEMSHT